MRPVLKYPGAKWGLAKWIIEHIPRHTVYLEPYFGSGAVFFKKEPSKLETINDISGDVVNLFRVIRSRPEELARLAELTPWSRQEYLESYERADDELEQARRFLVRCWQAFGTVTGRSTGWRGDVQGLRGTSCPFTWRGVPQIIIEASERLRDAQIECKPALELLQRYNYPEVLVYADPPYPLSTRAGKMYADEMTDKNHLDLLEALDTHTGPVLLSGYSCDLYDDRLKHWERKTRQATAERGQTRQEVLWLNPEATKRLGGMFWSEAP